MPRCDEGAGPYRTSAPRPPLLRTPSDVQSWVLLGLLAVLATVPIVGAALAGTFGRGASCAVIVLLFTGRAAVEEWRSTRRARHREGPLRGGAADP